MFFAIFRRRMQVTDFRQEWAFLTSLPLHWFVQIGMAVLCGTIVGLERELKKKAAGIRTNAMICMGSTLYMLVSGLIMSQFPNPAGDLTRIAGQVVVGMGFIGAGTIIQSRGRVVGLTSAATMWVVAAIGLVVGAGFPLFGFAITLFVVLLLIVMGKMEIVLLGKCRLSDTEISFRDEPQTWERIRELFESSGKKIEESKLRKEKGVCFMRISYCTVHPDHKEFLLDLMNIPDIRYVSHSHF